MTPHFGFAGGRRPGYNQGVFVFIAAVRPNVKVLETQARVCPACGRLSLEHRRIDRELSLFFIPLFRLSKGVPYYACPHCGAVFDEEGRSQTPASPRAVGTCRFCGRTSDPDFTCCPYCGTPRAG